MAVVTTASLAYFIDAEKFFMDVYAEGVIFSSQYRSNQGNVGQGNVGQGNAGAVSRNVKCKILGELFEIHERFRMDTEYAAIQNREVCVDATSRSAAKKLKRLRKKKLVDMRSATLRDLAIQRLLSSVLAEVSPANASHSMVKLPLVKNHGNNAAARVASRIAGPGDALKERTVRARCRQSELYVIDEECARRGIDDSHLFGCIVHVNLRKPSIVPMLGAEYLLPATCTFLMSDLDGVEQLVGEGKCHDFIVIDPPWENKSVKRKSIYSTLDIDDLSALPVDQLSNDGCIVACWVTNNSQHIACLRQTLFPAWKLAFVGEWHWLKVTTQGEAVHDVGSSHQKPYETLCIGRRAPHSPSMSAAARDVPPVYRVIVSVPCSLHSSKPPLIEVFRPFLPPDPSCLELFARNLLPGFTSWGNEVLRHQHVDFFEVETIDQPDDVVNRGVPAAASSS